MLTGWFNVDRHFAMMDELRRQLDGLFDDYEQGRHTLGVRTAGPRMNLFDAGEHLVLQAEVPGLSQDDIEISGNQESLTLSGQRKVETPEGYTVHRQERPEVQFSRTVTFPVAVDVAEADASLKNGILEVKLPKLPEARPRSIEVKAR